MVLIFRYVLDGWPLTREHVDLLTKFHILPVCVVELEVSDQEMLRRGDLDRKGPNRSAVFVCVCVCVRVCVCVCFQLCEYVPL